MEQTDRNMRENKDYIHRHANKIRDQEQSGTGGVRRETEEREAAEKHCEEIIRKKIHLRA